MFNDKNKNTKINTKTRANFFLGKINFRGFFAHTKTITFWSITLFQFYLVFVHYEPFWSFFLTLSNAKTPFQPLLVIFFRGQSGGVSIKWGEQPRLPLFFQGGKSARGRGVTRLRKKSTEQYLTASLRVLPSSCLPATIKFSSHYVQCQDNHTLCCIFIHTSDRNPLLLISYTYYKFYPSKYPKIKNTHPQLSHTHF